MAAMGVQVHLYRKVNPDGTSKDWAVPVVIDRQKLTVYYGRTGSALRQADTPAQRCRDGYPPREVADRVREKLAKGYQSLGPFTLAANRRQLTPESAPKINTLNAPDAGRVGAVSVPALYWTWRPTAAANVDSQSALYAACRRAAAQLTAVGWTLPGSPEAVARDDYGLALWSVASGGLPHGVLRLADDNRAWIAFFLLLARQGIGMAIADEDARLLTTWPAELPVAADALDILGLLPKDPNRWFAATSGDAWFF